MRCHTGLRLLGLVALLVLGTGSASAEPQAIPPEVATQISKHLLGLAEKDARAPLQLQGDADKATGLYEQGAGGLIVVPIKGIKDGTELKGVDGAHGAGAGYLFLHRLALVVDGKPVANDKLHVASFNPVRADPGAFNLGALWLDRYGCWHVRSVELP